jgi:hypothetical protein
MASRGNGMTIHYHGTPITPRSVLETLAGACFCVSFAEPRDLERVHQIGQSIMLDNGAFSLWRSGRPTDWPRFYGWAAPWLDFATTWAVPPDVIDGDEAANDALLAQWPFPRHKARPVWHLHESLDRMERLVDEWPAGVCFGSSGEFAEVGSPAWHRRIGEAWDLLAARHAHTPWIHMLRGLRVCRMGAYPFASCDSTDVARNHNVTGHPRLMVEEWDSVQCPGRWVPIETHQSLFDIA